MQLHLIATDASAFELADALGPDWSLGCVIVPQNRAAQPKIRDVRRVAAQRQVPVFEHGLRSRFGDGIPPADAAVSWLYSQIIDLEDLARYPRGILNMHGGRIPEYRGASVLQWAIINGESEMGITWHEMVEAVDAGTIWAETTIPIPEDADAVDMRKAMVRAGIDLFPTAWARFLSREGGRRPNLDGGRVWPQRRPRHGLIESGWTERQVRDMVRALCPPWPPAFVETPGGTVHVRRVSPESCPGSIPYETCDGATLHLVPAQDGASC